MIANLSKRSIYMRKTVRSLLPSILSVVLLISIFSIFWIKASIFLDPDFGWRLKAGEMYLTSGIPKMDPFTYTMPSFSWVDHAWSQSALFYLVYSNFGYMTLALVYSGLALVSILLISWSVHPYFSKSGIYDKTGILVNPKFLTPHFISLA